MLDGVPDVPGRVRLHEGNAKEMVRCIRLHRDCGPLDPLEVESDSWRQLALDAGLLPACWRL